MTDSLIKGAQSHMLDLSSGRFHYLNWGTEHSERPDLVLLHGITSSAASWVRVGPALAGRYRVYALDMRGHGDSIKPAAGAYSLQETARDALEFIEALSLERPVLMGHSWGGATALVLASGDATDGHIPDLTSVILEDPACNFGRGDAEKRAASYVKDIGRPAAELRPEFIADNPGWTEEDIEGKLDAMGKVSREAVISVFEQGGQMGNILPLLAKLGAPTLLMRADPDGGTTLPGKIWDQAQEYLPAHSHGVQINGATHNIHRSKFDAFMQAVNNFLRE
jgi:N-formylmaleamate deformylase